MSSFTVHGIPGSPYVRKVLLMLEEKGAPWRIAAIPMGAHRDPGYHAVHPFHRIPTLDHGDFRLYEAQAILRYLERVLPGPSLIPEDARDEARMNQVMGIVDSYVRPTVSGAISFPRVVAPRFGFPVDEAAVQAALPDAENCIEEVARLLDDRPFIAGAALSLADLMLVPHLDYFAECAEGQAMFARHPNLTIWLARMRARPSMAATSWERVNAAAETPAEAA